MEKGRARQGYKGQPKGKRYNGHGDGKGGKASFGWFENDRGKGKRGKGGKRGPPEPRTGQELLRNLGDLDVDEAAAHVNKHLSLMVSSLPRFSLDDLWVLVEVFSKLRVALRHDHTQPVFQTLAGCTVAQLATRLLPCPSTEARARKLLEVLQTFIEAEPTSMVFLDSPQVKASAEAALCRFSPEVRSLWAGLTSQSGQLAAVVQRHERSRASVPAFPEPADVQLLPNLEALARSSAELPINRRRSGWEAGEEDLYRQTHFLLLREELLTPLREAVASFLDSQDQVSAVWRPLVERLRSNGTNFFAYSQTHAVGFALSRTCRPMVQLKFSLGRRRVDFSTGSHLIFGSLVILFEQDSQGRLVSDSGIYATIEDFDLQQVERHQIVGASLWDSESWQRFSVNKSYVMVESPGYFHAVKPILDWLKVAGNLRRLPLLRDLLGGERRDRLDLYQDVRVDISCLYKRELDPELHWRNQDPLATWPDPHKIELDPSQRDALRHILLNTVPLIQGPPGTGKSYIGVKAVQLLRQMLDKRGCREPIVLICLTNHALDQFLEDLLDIFPDRLRRFGGRMKSENEQLQMCQVSRHIPRSHHFEHGDDRRQKEESLERDVSRLEQLRRFVATRSGHLRCLMRAMPSETLIDLFEALGEDVLDAGLFLPRAPDAAGSRRAPPEPNPDAFMQDVLHHWSGGSTLAQIRNMPIVSLPDATGFAHGNQFAAFADEEDGEDGRILSPLERALLTSPSPRLTSFGDDSDGASEESQDEGLDWDEVQAVMDDRMEMAGSRSRFGRQRFERASVNGATGLQAVVRRQAVLTEAQRCEQRILGAMRQRDEAIAQAEETAAQRRMPPSQAARLCASAAHRWEVQLEALKRQGLDLKSRVQEQRRHARAAQIRAMQAAQIRIQQHKASLDEALSTPAIRSLAQASSWQSSKNQRSVQLTRISEAVSAAVQSAFQEGFQQAHEKHAVLEQIKKQGLLKASSNAAVVGMTSTFAALNRDLLQRLGPRVVVVEEAGELLECQLLACLSSPNLEKVVLIGDHQQLRPKINSFDLARTRHFDISLFERLIMQGCDRITLTTQLRMQPNVCDLVRPFYSRIDDHARVMRYPPVPGVAQSLFWLAHSWQEDNVGQALQLSKLNSNEARFAARLAQHLVFNGVDKSHITLLTPYLGQKRELKKHLPRELMGGWMAQEGDADEPLAKGKGKGMKGKEKGMKGVKGQKGKGDTKGCGKGPGFRFVPGVRVVTIDDYQGEENDVIILSLVRSNPRGKLGFCAIENRIIVALSRARHGMYILGDAEMFYRDERWTRVLNKLESHGRVGSSLNLRCALHPTDEGLVCKAADFDEKARHGGCQRWCNTLLPRCGHRCPLRCHPYDREHAEIECVVPCSRPRPTGCTHRCSQLCKDCPGDNADSTCTTPCTELVQVHLPCNHNQRVHCHVALDPVSRSQIKCQEPQNVQLPCGHTWSGPCHQASNSRSSLLCTFSEQVRAPCGHMVEKRCHTVQPCKKVCRKTFDGCGQPDHLCARRCSEPHEHTKCPHPCTETLLCGHACKQLCGEAHTSLCHEPCTRACTHGFQCPKKCYELCVPCREPCGWSCRHHRCTLPCSAVCQRERCNEPCDKHLSCGHLCKGVCGEPCPTCVQCHKRDEKCPLSLEDLTKIPGKLYQLNCGHIFDLDMLDMHMRQQAESEGHVAIQAKACPTCRRVVQQCPRYNEQVKGEHLRIDAVKREVLRKHRELTEEERQQIDRAMGDGRSGAGHWFACPNGHPYFIGECGGAMQESTCPECGQRVGGSSHRLREDNRFVDFTGQGAQPAWPGVNQ